MKLGLCIVGCGGYADTVMNEIRTMTDEFDFYFASRDLAKAKAYCDRFGGADYFGGYEEALSDDRVQAAYFFTPHHLHLESAQLAARHRKHILIEKPIARSIGEAQALIQTAQDGGVKLMVAENYRFLHAAARAKAMVDAGNIGALRLVNIQAEGFRPPRTWRNDATLTGGGSFIDAGVHFVDIMVSVGGLPLRIYAAKPPKTHLRSEGEDGMVMMANLPGGAVGVINFSRATTIARDRVSVAVTGSKGHIEFAPYGDRIDYENGEVKRSIRLPNARRGAPEMLREFRAAVLEDREPAMPATDAVNDLAVVLAAYKSADEGRHIALSEIIQAQD